MVALPSRLALALTAWVPLALVLACGQPAVDSAPQNAAGSTPPGAAPAAAVDGALVGRWRGTLPCADCPGIDTELDLHLGAGGISGSYRLVEIFAAKRGAPRRVESRGEWLAERAAGHDPQATVYRLEPETGGEARYFLAVDDELEALDRQAHPIASRANLRLRLVEEAAAGEGAP